MTWDATNSTLTVTVASTDAYDNGTSLPTTGDLLAQINENTDVQTAYDAGTIKTLVISGVVNAGDFAAIVNKFEEVDFRGVTGLHGVYTSGNSSATSGEAGKAITNKWPFKPFGSDTTVKKITLSATISGYNNQVIGSCTSVETLVIPSTGATSLAWGPCTGCTSLSTVTFEGTNITQLAGDSFSTNTSLKGITIPSSIKSFSSGEFKSSGLTSIDIPSTLVTIGSGCFESCSDLTTVTLNWTADQTVTLTSPEGIFPSQFYKDGGSNSITIPNDLSCVAIYDILAETYSLKHEDGTAYTAGYVYSSSSFQSAFEAAYTDNVSATEAQLAAMTSLTLSDASITDFSDLAAFTGLTSLALDGCTGCTALDLTANTSLTAGNVTASGLTALRLTTAQYTTDSESTWKAMLAEDGAIFLDDNALATYPVQTISYDATNGGTLAVEVNSTDTVDGTVPASGDLLVQINGNTAAKAAYDAGTIGKLVLSGTINAGDYTTIYKKFNVVDMSGVTQMVGDYYISSSDVEASASTDDTPYTYLPYYAFYPGGSGDTVMTEFVSPQNIVYSGSSILKGATSLTKVTITSGTFGDIAWASFQSCSKLTTVVFGTVEFTFIAGNVFASCTTLANVTIPSTVTSIGNAAFNSCKALTSIDIPVGLTAFGTTVFTGCTGLTNVTVHWDSDSIPASFATTQFANGAAQALTVPYGTKAAYEALDFTNVTEAAEVTAD